MNWFSLPEISKVTKMPILNVLHGDFLFVNSCMLVCKDGFDGISKLAWHKVADHDSSSRIIGKSLGGTRLLHDVDLQSFPPYNSHIKCIPIIPQVGA